MCSIGSGSRVSPLRASAPAKTLSTADRMSSVERNDQLSFTVSKLPLAARTRLPKKRPLSANSAGIGALEGIDRLLLVADRKDRAVDVVARAEAGKELFGEAPHDIPLRRAGVLRLVDQDVVDALVELVLHPGADIGARQQPHRAGDQVVEVEEAARRLHPLVARDQPVGDDERRRRRLQHAEQRQRGRPLPWIAVDRERIAFDQVGDALAQRLLEELVGIGLAVDLQEARDEQFQPALRIGFGEGLRGGRQDVLDDRLVRRPLRPHPRIPSKPAAVEARQRPDRRGDRVRRLAGVEAEFLEQRRKPPSPLQLVDESRSSSRLPTISPSSVSSPLSPARSRISAKAPASAGSSEAAAPVIMARRASAISDCSICWSSISKWPAMFASSGN